MAHWSISQDSQLSHGWTLGYCKYLDCLKTVNVYYVAVASHQEGKHNFYIPRGGRFRQRPLSAQLQSDLEWRSQHKWLTASRCCQDCPHDVPSCLCGSCEDQSLAFGVFFMWFPSQILKGFRWFPSVNGQTIRSNFLVVSMVWVHVRQEEQIPAIAGGRFFAWSGGRRRSKKQLRERGGRERTFFLPPPLPFCFVLCFCVFALCFCFVFCFAWCCAFFCAFLCALMCCALFFAFLLRAFVLCAFLCALLFCALCWVFCSLLCFAIDCLPPFRVAFKSSSTRNPFIVWRLEEHPGEEERWELPPSLFLPSLLPSSPFFPLLPPLSKGVL